MLDRGLEEPPGLRVELAEVSVFVCLILPSLVLSFFTVGEGGEGGVSFALEAAGTMARDLSLLALIAYFVWRNGEGIRKLGWRSGHVFREAILGTLLFIPVTVSMSSVEALLHRLGVQSAPSGSPPAALTPHGTKDLVLAAALVVVVAVVEETIFRGYLLLRFRRVMKSPVLAVLLSTLIFAVGHGYEGSIGVVTVGFMGFVLALIRVWRGSLTAPVVIHFLQDIISIVIVPLLASRP